MTTANDYTTITEEEVDKWCRGTFSNHALTRLHDILIGEYPLSEARDDILSFRPESAEIEQ